MAPFLLALFIGGLLCGLIGVAVSPAGMKGQGFALGVLLGPIGILIAAVLGNRQPAPQSAPQQLMARTRDLAPDPSFNRSLAEAPLEMTIRRDGHILGTWPLSDVLEYLTDGRLLPGDHYLQNPATNSWRLLSRLQ